MDEPYAQCVDVCVFVLMCMLIHMYIYKCTVSIAKMWELNVYTMGN